MKWGNNLLRYGFIIFAGVLFVTGIDAQLLAQSPHQAIATASVSPVNLQTSIDTKDFNAKKLSPKYAIFTANKVKRAAFYLYKDPHKMAHQVMWFYHHEGLKNIAGLESVGELGAQLNNLILDEPKTSASEDLVKRTRVRCRVR